jgi:nucleoside phosphorylase
MAKKKTDILVYIAMSEELQHVIDTFDISFTGKELKDLALTPYSAEIPSNNGNKKYNIVLVAAGTMGNTNSAAITSQLIGRYNPANIVVIGIAGSLSDDLSPGDVFIPNRITEYLANTAATGRTEIEVKVSGNYFQSDRRLLNRFANFSLNHQDKFSTWETKSEGAYKAQITEEIDTKLKTEKIGLHPKAKLVVGDDRSLASGPIVGKGEAFAEFIKAKVDRKAAAIEMESAGVYASAETLITPPRMLAIRGISDLASDKKAILEKIVGPSLRKICMQNAVSLLELAIKEDLFAPEEKKSGDENKAVATTVKKVFLIGGETGSGDTSDDSLDDYRSICETIGKKLAKGGLELIVCSPFTDSADYYASKAYAKANVGGQIHFHYPAHPDVIERTKTFQTELQKHKKPVKISYWQHPSYPSNEARKQAWTLCQLQALEQSDAVVAIGGKDTSSASTLLHLAEIWKIPVIPYPQVGGAAEASFKRINWKARYPSIREHKIADPKGPEKVVKILTELSTKQLSQNLGKLEKINAAFISRASANAETASQIESHLRERNITIYIGDNAVSADKEVLPAIDEYIMQSQLFIALWTKNYALSPWCHDELMFAINREKSGLMNILIIQLDDTPVIPTEARGLNIIANKNVSAIKTSLSEILQLK